MISFPLQQTQAEWMDGSSPRGPFFFLDTCNRHYFSLCWSFIYVAPSTPRRANPNLFRIVLVTSGPASTLF